MELELLLNRGLVKLLIDFNLASTFADLGDEEHVRVLEHLTLRAVLTVVLLLILVEQLLD